MRQLKLFERAITTDTTEETRRALIGWIDRNKGVTRSTLYAPVDDDRTLVYLLVRRAKDHVARIVTGAGIDEGNQRLPLDGGIRP